MKIGKVRCTFYREGKSKNNLQTANVCAKIKGIVLENDTKRFLFGNGGKICGISGYRTAACS